MNRDEFLAIFGEVFESSAWVAGDAWAAGPFESLDCLHHAMVEAMHAADRSKRLALIEAHPDLAKRVSGADPMTTASTAEQTRAGLTSLGRDEQRRFLELNAAYRKRFGFPFIIAVKGLDKPAILAAFEARLENPPELEFEGALGEIAKIARFRLADISISWAAERLPRLSSR